ncbi:hypothetical protein [Streptomyces odonnellii]|uniref:hypothetical protein n=1 Tax=Streptomyces odonnellii TaxID=1417980 RepID=UPI0006251367|nr:hypothetical protein [Streptomyces odonnellii]
MSAETPEQVLATADQDVTEAETTVTNLETRVREGDQDVTPDQIEEARSTLRFVHLRREAAVKRADQLRQEQVDTAAALRRDAFLADIAAYDLGKIPELQERIQSAVYELLQLCAGHSRVLTGHAFRLTSYGSASTLPVSADIGAGSGTPTTTVTVDGTVYQPADGNSAVKSALDAARQRHFEDSAKQDARADAEDQAFRAEQARKLAESDARRYGTPAWDELPARRRIAAERQRGLAPAGS